MGEIHTFDFQLERILISKDLVFSALHFTMSVVYQSCYTIIFRCMIGMLSGIVD